MPKITKDTNLADIMKLPGAEKIMAKYKVPCLTCPMAKFEIGFLKIGQICQTYKIDVNDLLKELNEKYGKK